MHDFLKELNKNNESNYLTGTVSSLNPLQVKIIPTDDSINVVPTSNLHGVAVGSRLLLTKLQDQFIALCVIQSNSYPIGYIDYVIKSADTSRSSTTTVDNDPHLVLTLPPYGIYEVDAWFIVAADSVDPDIKIDWDTSNITALMGDGRIVLGPYTGMTSYGTMTMLNQNYALSSDVGYGVDDSGEISIWEKMLLSTDEDSGTLQMRWAQRVNSADNTTLKSGSYLKFIKINHNY
jgi:hypothetical protein